MLRHKAQSSVEYALLIAVAVAAIVAVQFYMQRGVQGRLKESTDQIGKQFEAGAANTYRSYWKRTSDGNTVTRELRNAAGEDTLTRIVNSENVYTNEAESWGEKPPEHY